MCINYRWTHETTAECLFVSEFEAQRRKKRETGRRTRAYIHNNTVAFIKNKEVLLCAIAIHWRSHTYTRLMHRCVRFVSTIGCDAAMLCLLLFQADVTFERCILEINVRKPIQATHIRLTECVVRQSNAQLSTIFMGSMSPGSIMNIITEIQCRPNVRDWNESDISSQSKRVNKNSLRQQERDANKAYPYWWHTVAV